MRRIRVAGVAMRGDGYPNAVNTVELLKSNPEWDVHDRADWLPPETRLWHLMRGAVPGRIRLMLRLLAGGFIQALRLSASARPGDVSYLPYPAPLTLFWLAIVPERWRPHCIADAYISLWDSTFRDRARGDTDGVVSRAVRFFEARALGAASLVLVDTEANRSQFLKDFGLSEHKVRSVPLAIDESKFSAKESISLKEKKTERVLFVGTLVPLHGIEVVLAAAAKLSKIPGYEFRLVGNGQQSGLVEKFINEGGPENFTWIREWKTLRDVASEIEAADICLGVFGGAGKASRVLPYKLYYALCAGKAMVTQSGYSLPKNLPPLAVELVPVASVEDMATQLVASIRRISDDADIKASLESWARTYFARHLSSRAILAEWRDILSRYWPSC
jgi:Glycosyltransferase